MKPMCVCVCVREWFYTLVGFIFPGVQQGEGEAGNQAHRDKLCNLVCKLSPAGVLRCLFESIYRSLPSTPSTPFNPLNIHNTHNTHPNFPFFHLLSPELKAASLERVQVLTIYSTYKLYLPTNRFVRAQ